MSGSFREFLTPCSIGLWSRSVKVVTSTQLSTRFGPVGDELLGVHQQMSKINAAFAAFAAPAQMRRLKFILAPVMHPPIPIPALRQYPPANIAFHTQP